MRQIPKKIILLAILILLLVVVAGLTIWQKENIKALLDYATYTQEELEDQLQQNDQAIKDAVSAVPEITIRDVTEEEREALKEGSLTQQDLIDQLVKPNDPPKTPSPVPEQETPEADMPQPAADPGYYEKRLSELVAEVYVLREEYLIALDTLWADAKVAYKSTPPNQRTDSWLANMVSSYLAEGTALEKECDRRMDAIVIEMKALIKSNNGDLSLVDTVIETYANEKRLKKAWYMSKLEERGLI